MKFVPYFYNSLLRQQGFRHQKIVQIRTVTYKCHHQDEYHHSSQTREDLSRLHFLFHHQQKCQPCTPKN